MDLRQVLDVRHAPSMLRRAMRAPTRLLTPAMSGVLDRIARANRPPFHTLSPREARALYEAGAEVLDLPREALARVEELELAGRPARLYAPSHDKGLPLLLYLHGGGFVIGSLETHDSLCRQLALRSGGAVVALDYRLAPEHRFPAAQDDAWAALQWLEQHAGALGLDATRLAVGGDSAGGTLAAVCAIRARDHGLPLSLQLLITPGTAPDDTHASRHLFANGFLLDAATIDWFFDHATLRSQRHDWRFAPLVVEDLEGLAPACMIVAECDPIADEGVAYADRLRAAGVPVALDLVRGMTHEFIKMGRVLKEAGAAQQFAADALARAWRAKP
jgi:acetyl esterase